MGRHASGKACMKEGVSEHSIHLRFVSVLLYSGSIKHPSRYGVRVDLELRGYILQWHNANQGSIATNKSSTSILNLTCEVWVALHVTRLNIS